MGVRWTVDSKESVRPWESNPSKTPVTLLTVG
jgi:hypothetical protein